MVGTRSLAALCGGNTIRAPGAPPKAQEVQNSVSVCRRPERHRRVFSLCDPPVPSRRLNLNMPKGLKGQSGERAPFTR